jgi:hypothetical protein
MTEKITPDPSDWDIPRKEAITEHAPDAHQNLNAVHQIEVIEAGHPEGQPVHITRGDRLLPNVALVAHRIEHRA